MITLANSRNLSGKAIFMPCRKIVACFGALQRDSSHLKLQCLHICYLLSCMLWQKVVGHCQDFHIRLMENLFQDLRVKSGSAGHLTLSVILSHRRHGWEGWVEGELCLKHLKTDSVLSAPWNSIGTCVANAHVQLGMGIQYTLLFSNLGKWA